MADNQFGLDSDYFIKLCAREFSPDVIRNQTPKDLARAFARAARTACAEVLAEAEFSGQTAPAQLERVGWRWSYANGGVSRICEDAQGPDADLIAAGLSAESPLRVQWLYADKAGAEQRYSTTSDRYRAELYDEVWEKARALGHGNITEALAELERLRAAPVGVPDECPHMIVFDDADREPLMFAGAGARPAAIRAWEQISASWNAHLFVRVERNTRDDRYPCAVIAAPAAPAPAPAAAAREPAAWIYYNREDLDDVRTAVQRWEDSNKEWIEAPLYTIPPAAWQPDAVKVPRKTLQAAADLLFSMDDHIARIEGNDRSHSGIHAELRALLARGDA